MAAATAAGRKQCKILNANRKLQNEPPTLPSPAKPGGGKNRFGFVAKLRAGENSRCGESGYAVFRYAARQIGLPCLRNLRSKLVR